MLKPNESSISDSAAVYLIYLSPPNWIFEEITIINIKNKQSTLNIFIIGRTNY